MAGDDEKTTFGEEFPEPPGPGPNGSPGSAQTGGSGQPAPRDPYDEGAPGPQRQTPPHMDERNAPTRPVDETYGQGRDRDGQGAYPTAEPAPRPSASGYRAPPVRAWRRAEAGGGQPQGDANPRQEDSGRMQWPTARGVTPERRQPSPFGQKENTPLFPPSQPVDPEPSETAAPVRATLPMQEAIRAAEEGEPNSPNPLIAEATALLILLGRLRTGMVIIDIGPLMNFTDRTLRTYRDRLLGRGVSDHDARDAQFVVAALADDIVQNLHRVDTSYWMSQPMVGRFFPSRNAGEEFYDLVHDALRSARQRRDLLQLQHLCLCLGFEGKYASPFPNGRNKIAEVRGDVYAMLEQVFGRTNDDLSPNWKPIATRRERRGFQVPFFALFGISAFLVVGAVSAGTYYNSRHSVELSTELENLHRPGGIPLREVEITPRSFDDLAEAIAAGGAEPEPEIVEVDQVGTIEVFLAVVIAR